jgi:hypothetical protein
LRGDGISRESAKFLVLPVGETVSNDLLMHPFPILAVSVSSPAASLFQTDSNCHSLGHLITGRCLSRLRHINCDMVPGLYRDN